MAGVLTSFRDLDASSWGDFEAFFGAYHGVRGGCWCAFHLLPSGSFNALGREGRRDHHRAMVERGLATGLLGYAGDRPVAWCQFGPASSFEQLNRGKAYKAWRAEHPEYHDPSWRITCLFVDRAFRRRGLVADMLCETVARIDARGGGPIEAFPLDLPGNEKPQYTGSVRAYEREGFTMVARMGTIHVLMHRP